MVNINKPDLKTLGYLKKKKKKLKKTLCLPRIQKKLYINATMKLKFQTKYLMQLLPNVNLQLNDLSSSFNCILNYCSHLSHTTHSSHEKIVLVFKQGLYTLYNILYI